MSIAILGAGAAGLAAAHALARPVTVFEKSRGVSGRAATRWRDATDAYGAPFRWRYDHGAQYISPEAGSRAHRLLTDTLDASGLVDLGGTVWPFDDDGTLRPDRARHDPGPRLTYTDGISTLGRRLLDAAPEATLVGQTRVASMAREDGLWRLFDTDGADLGAFEQVLLTPPAPQIVGLLGESEMDDALRQRLVAALSAAEYRSQFTVVLAFPEGGPRPEPYALVNAAEHGETGGGHAVAWLAVESDKPGRAPEGATLLLAQMSPAWTEAHYDDAKADVVREASGAIASLLGTDLPEPAWADTQRWRYALPNAGADAEALAAASGEGLFFAGDAVAGKGRVHLALESGLEAADRMRDEG
ncbi:MAG: FAD-dependent oxidoreductase [Bacteroidota bacterium]